MKTIATQANTVSEAQIAPLLNKFWIGSLVDQAKLTDSERALAYVHLLRHESLKGMEVKYGIPYGKLIDLKKTTLRKIARVAIRSKKLLTRKNRM